MPPKPPKKPVLPSQPTPQERPNHPIDPSRGQGDHPVETPPEEAEREQDPRSRDHL